jgi:hypothetical protein
LRYLKAFLWSTTFVLLLTFAQYGSVHLLTQRPATWLFEASLDLAPPLLFAGDVAQSAYTHSSQAPLREQLPAVALGVLVNICAYGILAVGATWLFLSAPHTAGKFNAAKPTR